MPAQQPPPSPLSPGSSFGRRRRLLRGLDPTMAPVSAPPCEPGQVLAGCPRFMHDLGGGPARFGGFCRVVKGPALVLAVVWLNCVWYAMVASVGGACGWIGMGEL